MKKSNKQIFKLALLLVVALLLAVCTSAIFVACDNNSDDETENTSSSAIQSLIDSAIGYCDKNSLICSITGGTSSLESEENEVVYEIMFVFATLEEAINKTSLPWSYIVYIFLNEEKAEAFCESIDIAPEDDDDFYLDKNFL